jgi:hydrogenase small subunit
MSINRRSFMRYCVASAAVLGLSRFDLLKLRTALANPNAPKVIWLQGACCAGCSISFLNRISASAPTSTAALLTDDVDLIYHPTLMAAVGETASDVVMAAISAGNYLLVVEGGVPTAFGGGACIAWTRGGSDTTFQDAVSLVAAQASRVIAVGACASFGGVPSATPNPGSVKSVQAAIGKPVINVPGCPPHPDWIVWVIAQLLAGNPIQTDASGRPLGVYGTEVHAQCPRLNTAKSAAFGLDNHCLLPLGCRGPGTMSPCANPSWPLWNNDNNWCVDANGLCIACTEPTFPGGDFYQI